MRELATIKGMSARIIAAMTRRQIGELAKAARLAKGLSFREAEAFALSKEVKITAKQIGFIEEGTTNYTIETIIAYAGLYGDSIDWVKGKAVPKKRK